MIRRSVTVLVGKGWKCEGERTGNVNGEKGRRKGTIDKRAVIIPNPFPHTFVHLLDKPRAALCVRLYLCLNSPLEAVELAGSVSLEDTKWSTRV